MVAPPAPHPNYCPGFLMVPLLLLLPPHLSAPQRSAHLTKCKAEGGTPLMWPGPSPLLSWGRHPELLSSMQLSFIPNSRQHPTALRHPLALKPSRSPKKPAGQADCRVETGPFSPVVGGPCQGHLGAVHGAEHKGSLNWPLWPCPRPCSEPRPPPLPPGDWWLCYIHGAELGNHSPVTK